MSKNHPDRPIHSVPLWKKRYANRFKSWPGKLLVACISLLALGTSAFLLSSRPVAGDKDKPLYLVDMNIQEVTDATPVVIEALKRCKQEGYNRLVFPKDTFHFYPTFAPDFYCAITNNDNGLKRTSFPIINFDHIEIDGGGSDFIYHGKMVPFIVEKSEQVTLRNFSIDWEVPFVLEGKVVANDREQETFDLAISTPYRVQYGRLYLSLERPDSPYERKFGHRLAQTEKDNLEVGQNITWNPTTMRPYYHTQLYQQPEIGLAAEELEPGLVRMTTHLGQGRLLPPVGSIYCSKGEYLFNRRCPAIRVFQAKDVQLLDINIYHAGAMGLIAERSEDITLDNFNVKLREGSGRMITTTADATHFCNVKGTVTIRNCLFENMLDDATNIHGTYVRVNSILGDNRLAVETYHPHQNGYLFGEAGDKVSLVKNGSLKTVTSGLVITKVERINEKISILTFNQSLAGKVELYDGIENTSWVSSAVLEHNVVRNNRARSFLISTPQSVVIRNNHLSSQMTSLLVTGDLGLWNESGPCQDLLIENNTFEDCLYSGGKQSVILIDPQYNSDEYEGTYYSRNITIRNNLFKVFDMPIMKAVSVDGLTFTGNQVICTDTYEPIHPDHPNLEIMNCHNVEIARNTYTGKAGQDGTVEVDEASSRVVNGKGSGFVE